MVSSVITIMKMKTWAPEKELSNILGGLRPVTYQPELGMSK
jgi:hypothetical protein